MVVPIGYHGAWTTVARCWLSRSLLGFLLFCLSLAVATAGLVWYVGPTLAGIVVDSERRENPYFLLQLLPAAAIRSGDEGGSYRSRFVTLAAEDQGQLLWQGGAVRVAEGSVLLDVAAVQLVKFDSGSALVQMLTGSAYRALESGFSGEVRHLGSSQPPGTVNGDEATVVVLYRSEPEPGQQAPLGVPGSSGWLALLPRYQGTVRWDASVAAVRGAGDWDRALMIQFPDVVHAEAWLEDPATVTERAIAGTRVEDMVVLVAQPSTAASRWNSRTVPNSSNSPRLGKVRAGISSMSR